MNAGFAVVLFLNSLWLVAFGFWLGIRYERANHQINTTLTTFDRDVAVADEAENADTADLATKVKGGRRNRIQRPRRPRQRRSVPMPKQTFQAVWTPEDAHEVFTRAATIKAIQAVTETDAHTAESALLAELVDREVTGP